MFLPFSCIGIWLYQLDCCSQSSYFNIWRFQSSPRFCGRWFEVGDVAHLVIYCSIRRRNSPSSFTALGGRGISTHHFRIIFELRSIPPIINIRPSSDIVSEIDEELINPHKTVPGSGSRDWDRSPPSFLRVNIVDQLLLTQYEWGIRDDKSEKFARLPFFRVQIYSAEKSWSLSTLLPTLRCSLAGSEMKNNSFLTTSLYVVSIF